MHKYKVLAIKISKKKKKKSQMWLKGFKDLYNALTVKKTNQCIMGQPIISKNYPFFLNTIHNRQKLRCIRLKNILEINYFQHLTNMHVYT